MHITHLNPDTLPKNPAFSQVVTVEGPAKMIYIGGQNAITPDGAIAGTTLAAQTEQAFKNLLAALQAAGATQEHVVKLTIYLVQGHAVQEGFAAAQNVWGSYPTAISVIIVAGLANPNFLVEIEAVAAVEG